MFSRSKFGLTGCLDNPKIDIPAGSCVQDTRTGDGSCEGDFIAETPGYRNKTGFPPCCAANPARGCVSLGPGGPGSKPQPPPGVDAVYDEGGNCINCGESMPKKKPVPVPIKNVNSNNKQLTTNSGNGLTTKATPVKSTANSINATNSVKSTANTSTPPPTKSSNNNIIYISLGAIALIVLVYFLFFYKKKKMFFGRRRR